MANEQYAFLRKDRVPSKDQWQQAINETGFDLLIDPDLAIFEHSGFLPCKLSRKDSGVETYYQAVTEMPGSAELAGDRDFCISFRWGGDFEEAACAMILSYSLAKSFDAIVSYEFEEPYPSLDALRADTEAIIQEAAKQA